MNWTTMITKSSYSN